MTCIRLKLVDHVETMAQVLFLTKAKDWDGKTACREVIDSNNTATAPSLSASLYMNPFVSSSLPFYLQYALIPPI